MSIEFALSRWTLLYRKCRSIVKMIMNRVLWCTKKELLYTKHCQYISRSANVKKRSAISLLNSIRQISEKPSGVIRSPGLPWKRFVWKSWRETEPPRYEIKTSIIPLQNNVRVILRTSVVNHRSMLWTPRQERQNFACKLRQYFTAFHHSFPRTAWSFDFPCMGFLLSKAWMNKAFPEIHILL